MKGLTVAMPSTSQIYPVGSIYISTNTTDPSTIFGGTWERIQDKFLVCCGFNYTNGSTGGSSTHTHNTADLALTANQMPSHNHSLLRRQQWYYNDTVIDAVTYAIYSWKSGEGTGGNTSYSWYSPGNRDIGYTGSGAVHNHGNTGSTSNMPPYLAVTVWKRIA